MTCEITVQCSLTILVAKATFISP